MGGCISSSNLYYYIVQATGGTEGGSIHSWAQRKLSPLNILLLINGPLLSLGFNGFND